MKHSILTLCLLLSASAFAEAPEDYYSSLEGKAGDELLKAVKAVARPSDFTTVTYNTKTWDAFVKTDVRLIDGHEAWWDMYSNNIVWLPAHASLNIEHTVANSWWGGNKKVSPYQDLFHLNPSDQEANGRKSDLPLGVVETPSYDNGLSKVGAPAVGKAGNASKVFEPADEYKGDFARAFLYIFTAFDDIAATWKDDQPMYTVGSDGHPALQPWALGMLCQWAADDPVDSKETARNDEIFRIQHNRNPFIDHPELIDYLWGEKKGKGFECTGESPADRPEAPRFENQWLRAVNTYAGRWWEEVTIPVTSYGEELWISIDGGDYQQYGSGITLPAAHTHSAASTIRAYSVAKSGNRTLRSSLSTLTLHGLDPDVTDWSRALWTPVASADDFAADSRYILLAPSNLHIMSCEGGTSSVKFMPDAGFAALSGDTVTQVPVDAATLRFHRASDGLYTLEVQDPLGNSKGFWNMAASGNNNSLQPSSGTAASVSFDAEGNAIIDFGTKKLKYNASQPRFTNYGDNSSTAAHVRLYKYHSMPIPSGIEEMAAEQNAPEPVVVRGRDVILPEGWSLYSINGIRLRGNNLMPGIYIAVHPNAEPVRILIR